MAWEILDRVGLVLGIIVSIIEVYRLIDSKFGSVEGLHNKIKSLPPDSFLSNFFMCLTIWGIASIILIPFGFLFPDFTFSSGFTIFAFLGLLWISFPFAVIFFWLDFL